MLHVLAHNKFFVTEFNRHPSVSFFLFIVFKLDIISCFNERILEFFDA